MLSKFLVVFMVRQAMFFVRSTSNDFSYFFDLLSYLPKRTFENLWSYDATLFTRDGSSFLFTWLNGPISLPFPGIDLSVLWESGLTE